MSAKLCLVKDNLNKLKELHSESVDCFCYDPLYNSNKLYVGTPSDDGSVHVMKDIWKGGQTTYLSDFNNRAREMYRSLKSNGTIIVHCDQTVGFYIYTELINLNMYPVNTIIWSYSGGGISKRFLPNKHDYIHVFSKTKKKELWTYNPIQRHYANSTKSCGKHSTYSGGLDIDIEKGTPLTSVWDVRSDEQDRLQAKREGWGWVFSPDFGPIKPVTGWAKSPGTVSTEKPLGLYKRLIYIYTNENNLVVDPYMGGGTTLLAAAELKRNTIGMDSDVNAYKRTCDRLRLAGIEYTTDTKESDCANINYNSLIPKIWEKRVMALAECDELTPPVNDGAIDGINHKTKDFWEAKKYSNNVGVVNVRNFIAGIESKQFLLGKEYNRGTMVTQIGYTRSAYTLADEVAKRTKGDLTIRLWTLEQLLIHKKKNLLPTINMFIRNKSIVIELENLYYSIKKYIWKIEQHIPYNTIFDIGPKSIIKSTTENVLSLDEYDMKTFNRIKCTLIDSEGQKFIKSLQLK